MANTVDWSRWLDISQEERDELRKRYRRIVKDESDRARFSGYAAMIAALADGAVIRNA